MLGILGCEVLRVAKNKKQAHGALYIYTTGASSVVCALGLEVNSRGEACFGYPQDIRLTEQHLNPKP